MEPSPQNASPSTVASYRLLERVGIGGSSSVWRALGPGGDIVAVKLLDETASRMPAERRRFQRAFRIASNLRHPGIARLIEAGEHEDRLFVVEEFIEGETLSDHLRTGRLPVSEALRILRQTTEILGYAHQAGIVHRDLSPRNIMLGPGSRVVLVDFGIAVRPEGTTHSMTAGVAGTLNYLAPELIRGQAASARTDLYALGAIAYEMIAGTPPFVATNTEALLRLHLTQRPTSLRVLRPEVDPRVDRLVLRLLSKRPADRFDNTEALLIALDQATRPRRPRSRGAAMGPAARRPAPREARAIRRLAVNPFSADLDDGTDPERMTRVAHGLAEAVAAGLAAVEGLAIIPPSEVRAMIRPTAAETAEVLGVDAVLAVHIVQRDGESRLAWTITGRDGALLAGGRLGEAGDSLFALEEVLLQEIVRAVRGPSPAAVLRRMAAREEWYAPFLEALGCLQRSDDEESVDRAIALLEGIRDAGAGGVQVHAALGRGYLRKAEMTLDPEWRRRAEASCRIAISLDPLAPEAMLTMGRAFLSEGRAEEGVAILRRALELDPRNALARIVLSRLHESVGNLDEADRVAREARAERPELWFVHERCAVLDFRRGRYRDAVAAWTRVVELTPDNARARSKIAAAMFELGDLDGAEAEYRTSLEMRRTPLALAGLGSVLFYQGRAEEAIHWFEAAIALTPRDPRLWAWLADVQRCVAGRREEADASYDRAIDLAREQLRTNPSDTRTWGQLAVCLARRGLHSEAARALEHASRTVPGSTEVRVSAVFVHELAGRRPEALRELESIGKEGPLPYELRADPDLEELLECAEVQQFLGLPESPYEVPPNAGEVQSCESKTIRSK